MHMRNNECSQCGDRIVGKPGATGSKSSGGWCGSRRVTKSWAVCQDCTGAGEWQQELSRCKLQAEMLVDMSNPERFLTDMPEWRAQIVRQMMEQVS